MESYGGSEEYGRKGNSKNSKYESGEGREKNIKKLMIGKRKRRIKWKGRRTKKILNGVNKESLKYVEEYEARESIRKL